MSGMSLYNRSRFTAIRVTPVTSLYWFKFTLNKGPPEHLFMARVDKELKFLRQSFSLAEALSIEVNPVGRLQEIWLKGITNSETLFLKSHESTPTPGDTNLYVDSRDCERHREYEPVLINPD